MQAHALDRYHAGASRIHDLDPRVKIVLTVALILSNVALPDGAWPAFAAAWLVVVAGNLLAGLGPVYTLRRSFVALPFALAAITVIFSLPGRPLFAWSLGAWELVATDRGIVRFATIVVRSWLSVQLAILLVATTRFPDLMHALRHLHVPRIMVAIVSFMYRYLYVVGEEAQRLLRAREARSACVPGRHGGGSLLWRARVAGSMAGQLFLRSYERSDRVYDAMLARGYRGAFLTLNPHQMRPRDWTWLIAGAALALALQLVGRIGS